MVTYKDMGPVENMANDIEPLYEDNHVIAVLKPVNMPVQADITGDRDLQSCVKAYIREKYQKPGNVFAALVHRLDRPTGGVMVLARTSKSAARLTRAFQEHRVDKEYLCVVEGCIQPAQGRVTHWLTKDHSRNVVTAHNTRVRGSQKAILSYRLLDTSRKLSLLRVVLETGRSHQIRCQFSKLNHPLYGDRKYGRSGRQLALWAVRLSFPHPVKDEGIVLQAPPPSVAPWNFFSVQFPGQKTSFE